jgi:uncharacterized protein YkwD
MRVYADRLWTTGVDLNSTLTKNGSVTMMRLVLACTAMFAAIPAPGQNRDRLVDLINDYRAAPGSCEGRPASPVAPLEPHPALSNLQVDTGAFLEQTLERAGYPVARAEAISISGSPDARSAMAAIERKYCRTLLSTQFSAVGAGRTGDSWLIVFAQPAQPSPVLQLPDWLEVGKDILQAVNTARATGRACGERQFPAAPALAWNGALGEAALAHSLDMARQRYFSHQGKDGRVVGDRALQAGYRWRRIAENIAAGPESAEEVVTGWLSSPGHCANIMSGGLTEMGAAYAINTARATPRVYWTQVFGTPRW